MKHTYRFTPANTFDFPAIESWLEDMAAKGLFPISLNASYGKFRKATPKQLTYRIEILQYFDTSPPPKMAAMYEEFGWHFAIPYLEKGYLFYNEEEHPTELHTDPVVQSQTIEELYTSEKKLLACAIVILLLGFAALLGLGWKHLHLFLKMPFRFQSCLLPLYLLMVLLFALQELHHLKKLKETLKCGFPATHRKPYGKWGSRQKILCCYFLLVFLLFPCLDAANTQPLWQEDVVLSESGMPYVPLEKITPGQESEHCRFRCASTPLAPVQFELYEQSATAWMQISYMEVRPSALAKQTFLTMGADGCFQTSFMTGLNFMLEEKTVLPPSDTLTEGYFYQEGIRQMLALRKDNRLLLVRCQGVGDLYPSIDTFTDLLTQTYDVSPYLTR